MTFKGQIATCDFCGAQTDRARRDGWRWFGSSRRSAQRFPQDRDMCALCVERALTALRKTPLQKALEISKRTAAMIEEAPKDA